MMLKGWLRSPDDALDGKMIWPDPGQELHQQDGKTFHRHDVRCGTGSWIEFWEEGYTPPNREEKDKKR